MKKILDFVLDNGSQPKLIIVLQAYLIAILISPITFPATRLMAGIRYSVADHFLSFLYEPILSFVVATFMAPLFLIIIATSVKYHHPGTDYWSFSQKAELLLKDAASSLIPIILLILPIVFVTVILIYPKNPRFIKYRKVILALFFSFYFNFVSLGMAA